MLIEGVRCLAKMMNYLVVGGIAHCILNPSDSDDDDRRNDDFQRQNDPTSESESHVLPSQHTKLLTGCVSSV